MGGWLFGGSKRVNSDTPADTHLRVQTSLQGRPKAIGWGQNRVAGNTIWYGDFRAVRQATRGGKGGGGGGGGKGGGGGGSFNYSASVIISLGDGPITEVRTMYDGTAVNMFATPEQSVLDDLRKLRITPKYHDPAYPVTFQLGSYTQQPWSYLSAHHSDQALAYRGDVLACFANLRLGGSSAVPSFNFEVRWNINSATGFSGPDANLADVVVDFLTNADYGVTGFPLALMGDFGDFRLYCRAASLVGSPVLTNFTAANSFLSDLMKGAAAEFRWSAGKLSVVPYVEHSVTGNGVTYEPVLEAVYNLSESDLIGMSGDNGELTPVIVRRRAPSDVVNKVQVEYLDRSNLYNPVTIYASDDASIAASGRLRLSDLRAMHYFCTAEAANSSCSLQLVREQHVTQFTFMLGARFVRLDPMDVVTLTLQDSDLGLSSTPLRVIEIQENDDRTLTVTAEEFLGSISASVSTGQKSLGVATNANTPPGGINTPVIFEPTYKLAGGYEVWGAVSGTDHTLWGGCDVYASYSGSTYEFVGRVTSPARAGVLSAELGNIPLATTGLTVDQTHTLSVDLSSSGADLTSATQADAEAGNTLCWVDGELLAYATANLTAPNAYDLSYLVRGLYGTEAKVYPHAIGSQFAWLDSGIIRIPFNETRIGQTIHLKFVSFNIWGGGEQSLADVDAYSYTIQGTGKPAGLSLANMGMVVGYDDISPGLAALIDPTQETDDALAALMGEILDRDRQHREVRAAAAATSAAVVETQTAVASDIASLATSTLQLTAANASGTAAVEMKAMASADAVAAGLSASWSLRVATQPNGAGMVESGIRIEVLPDGSTRIVLDASKTYFGSSATKFVPFIVDAVSNEVIMQGVTKVASAVKSLATVSSGDPVMELDFVNGRLSISQVPPP